jgi:hypothetical protein
VLKLLWDAAGDLAEAVDQIHGELLSHLR